MAVATLRSFNAAIKIKILRTAAAQFMISQMTLSLRRLYKSMACGSGFILMGISSVTHSLAATNEIMTVAEIRNLPMEQVNRKTSVRLRGVVTFYDESLFSRFIQDDTAGIYL